MENLVILGSTGSIGCNALSVIRTYRKRFSIFALIAGNNRETMLAQAIEFLPKFIVMNDENSASWLSNEFKQRNLNIAVLFGTKAMCEIASHELVDSTLSAIVGAAGLLPTFSAIKKGKKILLANKESLVMCGRIFMQEVELSGAKLLPIDSEHNAIFQCLPFNAQQNLGKKKLSDFGISRLLLTGSGGPFRYRNLNTFDSILVEEACAHPNWKMGRKISVDSASMMNKGLEFIEARWLFNASPSEIDVIIHPESIIHSMIRYKDGSVLAQMGMPDMKTPIAYCLSYPDRIKTDVRPLDFFALNQLTFNQPDFLRYPCLKLAIEACKAGQIATTTLNAANEIAVDAFLNQQIRFTDISKIVEETLNKIHDLEPENIDHVLETDKKARAQAICSLSKVAF